MTLSGHILKVAWCKSTLCKNRHACDVAPVEVYHKNSSYTVCCVQVTTTFTC